MKNYKLLVPILLIVAFIGSIYTMYNLRVSQFNEYMETLEQARDYRKKDIQVDAEKKYLQALEQKPSVELYVEIGEFYLETEQERKAVEWGTDIVEAYPKDAAGYEFLMGIYDEREDYAACFSLADTFTKRELHSEIVSEVLSRINYTFFFNGEYENVGVFRENLCPVQVNGKWGYANQSGGTAIGVMYSFAGSFSGGLAPIIDSEGNAYFIDTAGNKKHVILGVEDITGLGAMENGIFPLCKGEKWYFYNTEQEELFGGYDAVSAITSGVAAVQMNGTWSLIDSTGADLTGKDYNAVVMDGSQAVFRNERIFVSNGSGYQMITSSGEVVGGDTYEDVRLFNDTTYAAVKSDGKWHFIDKEGTDVLERQYEDAHSYSNGLAAVKENGLWGFIDLNGDMVIEPQFEDAGDFNQSGCAFVCRDGKWSLLRLYRTNH